MAQQNKYWTTIQQACIPDGGSWVSAAWGRGDASANKLRMLNGAFETYHILRKSVAACPDAGMRKEMDAELDDAGTDGSGWGVCDLDDAFQHWSQAGPWTDNNTKTYMNAHGVFGAATPGIAGAKFCWGLPTNSMPGPTAAVNFFNSLDKKLEDLKSAITGHNAEVANLAGAIKAKNAVKTGDAFKSISKWAGRAKKGMFLAPKPSDKFISDVLSGVASTGAQNVRDGSFGAFTGDATKAGSGATTLGVGGAMTFMNAIGNIDTFLSVHKSALSSGLFDNRTATAFAALSVACSFVPVLGSFYAAVVVKLPGFFESMKDLFEEHNRAIIRETFVNN